MVRTSLTDRPSRSSFHTHRVVQGGEQAGAVFDSAGDLVLEDPVAAGFLQGVSLQLDGLRDGGDPAVADQLGVLGSAHTKSVAQPVSQHGE